MGRELVSRIRQRRIVAGMLVMAMTMVVGAETAAAQTGNFTCRASVLRAELPSGSTLLEPVRSNPANNPCANDSDGLPTINLGILGVGISARLLQSNTAVGSGGAAANATVADVRVNQLIGSNIFVRAATSEASVSCVNGAPAFAGSSEVVGLTVNGQPIIVTGAPNQVVLGGLLILNQRIVTADRITSRAVVVNLVNVLRVVVAESIADVSGDPCAPPHPPQCSDGVDNDGDGDTDYDARNNPPFHPFGDQQCTSADDNSEAT